MNAHNLIELIAINETRENAYLLSYNNFNFFTFTLKDGHSFSEAKTKEDVLYVLLSTVSIHFDGYTFEDIANEAGFDVNDVHMQAIYNKDMELIKQLKKAFTPEELAVLMDWFNN